MSASVASDQNHSISRPLPTPSSRSPRATVPRLHLLPRESVLQLPPLNATEVKNGALPVPRKDEFP